MVREPDDESGVVGAFTRGLMVFRPLALVYASVLAWLDRADMDRPITAVLVLGVLGVWTLAALRWRRITWTTVAIELTLASAGILATALAYPRAEVAAGALTIPGIWAAGPVVAAAILGGMRAGALGATVIALADIASVLTPNPGTLHNIVLLYLIGSLIGLAVDLARQAQEHLAASIRAEEAYAERERLSRVVHDGVLQALSFINRRGHQLGGPAVQLGDLAAEQERALRALISGGRTLEERPTTDDEDLTAALRALGGPAVSLSMPATPVTLPADRSRELARAVGAAVDNVHAHGGPDAQAWVFVEDLGMEVSITVRDNGIGMSPGRLDEAATEGRLGVASSIRGRLADLGGEASWVSAPGHGCTVVLRAPKRVEPLTRPARRR